MTTQHLAILAVALALLAVAGICWQRSAKRPRLRQSAMHPGLQVDDGGMQPSTITREWATFTVHYLQAKQKSNPSAPDWVAFTLVVYDEGQRAYPAECFAIPADQQPLGIDGFGSTQLEAYRDLESKLGSIDIGPKPQ
jgi:hypothetical protein